jgi:DNA (cytosine-5)-methyltransferase 1
MSLPTCIDVFCGCGGFSVGILQAGFEVVAALDHEPAAIATYYCNLCDETTRIIGEIPKTSRKLFRKPDGYRSHLAGRKQVPPVRALFLKDIFDVSGWDMMDAAGIEEVDLMVGSPPCQSFSKCNTRKKKNDLRGFMLFEYGRLIMEIHPKTFVMENVPQIADAKLPDGRNLIQVFREMTKDRDWDLYYEVQEMYPGDAWGRKTAKGTTTLCDFSI